MDFDNASFWEERYRTNIALGSGAGSKGQFLEYKQALLSDAVARLQPRSILDVGCGDLEVMRDITFSGTYTGIDVSPSVVQRNREIRPEWEFIAGDFIALAPTRELHADLVLCLDVLIHQHDPAVYREFVAALLGASRIATVMNGFAKLPSGRKLSPNVAFHEPIAKTLRDLGVDNVEILGTYRRTVLVLVLVDKR